MGSRNEKRGRVLTLNTEATYADREASRGSWETAEEEAVSFVRGVLARLKNGENFFLLLRESSAGNELRKSISFSDADRAKLAGMVASFSSRELKMIFPQVGRSRSRPTIHTKKTMQKNDS